MGACFASMAFAVHQESPVSLSLSARGGKAISIGELARIFSAHLEEHLLPVWVRGEVSGLKHYGGSGHRYFTLKDQEAQFSAVLWNGRATRMSVLPSDGMQVEALVRIVYYGKGGRLQLDVQDLREAGQGRLMQDFLELKERLRQEGLFAEELKRPLPAFPQRIGILTAREGAALQDMLQVLGRRQRGIKVFLKSTPVQGPDSGPALARNLKQLSARARELNLDLIILGRGGGSFEDLFGFNNEDLVRAIRACPVPVISAVGHEVDHGLSDLAADLRAPTPSAAAELAVPDRAEQLVYLNSLVERLGLAIKGRIQHARHELRALGSHRALAEPQRRLRDSAQRLDQLYTALKRTLRRRRQSEHDRLPGLKHRLVRALMRLHADAAERALGWKQRFVRLLSARIRQDQADLAQLEKSLGRTMRSRLELKQRNLVQLEKRLAQLELGRIEATAYRLGMARVSNQAGERVASAQELKENDKLQIRFHDGRVAARVTGSKD